MNLPEQSNPIELPAGLDTANNQPVAKAEKVRSALDDFPDFGNSVEDWLNFLNQAKPLIRKVPADYLLTEDVGSQPKRAGSYVIPDDNNFVIFLKTTYDGNVGTKVFIASDLAGLRSETKVIVGSTVICSNNNRELLINSLSADINPVLVEIYEVFDRKALLDIINFLGISGNDNDALPDFPALNDRTDKVLGFIGDKLAFKPENKIDPAARLIAETNQEKSNDNLDKINALSSSLDEFKNNINEELNVLSAGGSGVARQLFDDVDISSVISAEDTPIYTGQSITLRNLEVGQVTEVLTSFINATEKSKRVFFSLSNLGYELVDNEYATIIGQNHFSFEGSRSANTFSVFSHINGDVTLYVWLSNREDSVNISAEMSVWRIDPSQDYTDEEIGRKAFNNPPDDLDEQSKTHVRSALDLQDNLLYDRIDGESILRLGFNNVYFGQNDASVDVYRALDIISSWFSGHYTNDRLQGVLYLSKYIYGVDFPNNYYYRLDGNNLVPTTDGNDTATSDLRDYIGNARRLLFNDNELNELISDTSKSHRLTYPIDNAELQLFHGNANNNLILSFHHSKFKVDLDSFDAYIKIIKNEGEEYELFNEKTYAVFDKIDTDRYSINLKNILGASHSLKIKDLFKLKYKEINLNAGGRANEEAVNGTTLFNIPYLANSYQQIELFIDIPIIGK